MSFMASPPGPAAVCGRLADVSQARLMGTKRQLWVSALGVGLG